MKKLVTLILLFTGFFTFSAAAQSASDRAAIDNTIGFGPRLGYYKAQDADKGNAHFGLQTRLRFGAVMGLEGSLEYRAGQEFGINDFTVKTSSIPVTTSLLAFAPVSESFSPYGIAGIGAYFTNFDYSDSAETLGFSDDSSFNLGYHLGFGVELPFNENTALNVDYRYLFLNPDDNEESLDGASFNGNSVTASIMFYF
ncbi:MAG: porin family protein [Balneolaceae bacterium]